MYSISTVWQAVLGALHRFWSQRFIRTEDPILTMLRMELELERVEKSKLLDMIAQLAIPATTIAETHTEEGKELRPMGRKPWYIRKQELEADARDRARKAEAEYSEANKLKPIARVQSIEELENELAIGEG